MKQLTAVFIANFLTLFYCKQSNAQYSVTDTIQIDEVVVTGTPIKVKLSWFQERFWLQVPLTMP